MADQQETLSIKLHGVVEKIVPSLGHNEPEKAQIVIQEAEHLYKEIRIANALHDGDGRRVKLKEGSEVDVTIEAAHNGVDKQKD
jgi:hypothetical protein